MSEVEKFLQEPGKVQPKVKTSLSLAHTNFQKLKKYCQDRNQSPSSLLDCLIADFLKNYVDKDTHEK